MDNRQSVTAALSNSEIGLTRSAGIDPFLTSILAAFPFGFLVGNNGHIKASGHLYPPHCVGRQVGEFFSLTKGPAEDHIMTALRAAAIMPGQTVCRRGMMIGLRTNPIAEPSNAEKQPAPINVEGAIFEANGGCDLLFLGTISPLEIRNLHGLGLQVDEFGPVDPSPALAILAELNATMLSDAQQMNRRLENLLGEANTLTEELEVERSKAVQANRMKGEFLANMSHEIRTPINGILGNAELMLESELSQKQEHYAQTIGHSSEMLLALVNDILDFSKAESGELKLESAPFDFLRVVEDVAELLAPNALAKNIELAVRYIPDTPQFVIGDSVRIRQILCNLIGNAIKFTGEGYVLLTVELAEGATAAEGSLAFKISIKDTGIGIPPEKQAVVFERFAQADGSTTRNYGGNGLGLSICKRLVELMDGDLHVESTTGEGSTFWFTLVLRQGRNLQGTEADHSRLHGKKLLIVDDIEINRAILSEQLGASGMVCTAVENSSLAIEALRRAHLDRRPFDFVILDYKMPDETGLQLAARIESDQALAHTALIMLSSVDPRTEPDQTTGISAVLTKPARRKQLLDSLTALNAARAEGRSFDKLDRSASTGLTSGGETQEPHFDLSVLLVEDNRVNLMLAKENLKKLGCDVTTAENGEKAIDQVKETTFDIIFMDCMMPVMDGYEASRVISKMVADQELPKMPVVALTANAMPGDRERCLDAGMDDYVTKPIRKKNLVNILKKWVDTADQPQG